MVDCGPCLRIRRNKGETTRTFCVLRTTDKSSDLLGKQTDRKGERKTGERERDDATTPPPEMENIDI